MGGKASSHWPITLTNSAAALISIALPLVLVRILTPDQVGLYSIFFLYVMLCPSLFLTGGLTNGLYLWAGKYPEAKSEVRQSWTLLMEITLVGCTIGLICVHWAAPLIKIPPIDLQLILVSIPFVIASTFFEDLMIARGDIWRGSWYGSGSNVFRTTSLLVAAWWTRRVETVFWVFFAGAIVRAGMGLVLVRKFDEIAWLFSWKKTKTVLRYAVPVSLAGLGGMGLQSVDQMILSFRLNPASFAFYAMGCLAIPPLEIFETSVNRVLIPRLAQAFATNARPEAAVLFAEAVSELYRFLLPATVGLVIFSRPIVQILFTDRYLPAASFLRIYALTYLFLAFPFGSVARARGDGGWILRSSLFFAAISAVATWFAAGRWNAMGALVTLLVSQFLLRIYGFTYAARCLASSISRFLPVKDLLVQSGLALAGVLVSLLLQPLFSDARVWFLVAGPLFTLLYFGGTYAFDLRRHFNAPGPIHILELAQTLGLGGLERTVYSLSNTLNQHQRFKVLVATYDHPEGLPSLVPLFEEAGIPLIQWQKGSGFSFRSVFQLVQLTYSEKTRILHAHDLGPLIYGSLVKMFSLGRVRLVLTLHTLLDIEQNPRYRRYYKHFLRFPDRIIAVSEGIKTGLLALGGNPERIEVIPNGVSFSCFTAGASKPVEKQALRRQIAPHLSPDLYSARWLLCLARVHPGKGQDVVLGVWQALPQAVRRELALFIVGQETEAGYAEKLLQKIFTLPDADRIIVAGPSERPEDWIHSADIFISGSLLEGMPLGPLEATGCGLPTILSNIEGHRFLEPWAHYFDPRNAKEGAARVVEILDALKRDGETKFFENRWNQAASLREMRGASTMTAAYAEAFESA